MLRSASFCWLQSAKSPRLAAGAAAAPVASSSRYSAVTVPSSSYSTPPERPPGRSSALISMATVAGGRRIHAAAPDGDGGDALRRQRQPGQRVGFEIDGLGQGMRIIEQARHASAGPQSANNAAPASQGSRR
jgi:hypothetical protein